MQAIRQSSWNFQRGVRSAFIWGLAGIAVFTVLLCCAFICILWNQHPIEREWDRNSQLILSAINDSVVWFLFSGAFGAAAGWVSSAPKVQCGFAWSLALVFVVFVLLLISGDCALAWLESVGVMDTVPPAHKGSEHQPPTVRVYLLLFGPLFLAGGWLSMLRARWARIPAETEPGDATEGGAGLGSSK